MTAGSHRLMIKVVLSLGHGNLQNGFPAVTARLWTENPNREMQFEGSLPAAPDIPELYSSWQLLYSAYYQSLGWHPRIEIIDSPEYLPGIDLDEFSNLCQQLSESIDAWLNSELFRNINDGLRTNLNPKDEIQFIIETKDCLLWQLPWHLWQFFKDYPKAEVALSAPEYKSNNTKPREKTGDQVRILAILGNSKGINVEQDRLFLERLHDAEVKFMVEPERSQLNDQLWDESWDILFFAGHSCSFAGKKAGRIYINQTQSLTIADLKHAVEKAIAMGLKLAIFNSCDGLALALDLFDLHIPQTIVMRERVPDAIAQAFLKYFLAAFSGGKSLYTAVREARQRLQGLEDSYYCASWLPVIFQNPAEVPPSWIDLLRNRSKKPLPPSLPRGGWTVLLASVIVTGLIMGVRHLGMLQRWELQAFDQIMRSRPDEAQDPRLLVIGITEEDFQLPEQKQRKGSLSDLSLSRLLEKLEPSQPRAIGLDIYRDFPVESNYQALAARLRRNSGFFSICKVSAPKLNDPGISPPPEIPIQRQGFSDLVVDPDGILRRQLIAMKPYSTSPCTTPYSLGARLAFQYLKSEGISAKYTQKGELQLGKVVLKRWRSHQGGYQQFDDWGYQILLNYRSHRSPLEAVEKVSLKDVLTGVVKPDAIKNRIILIGVTAPSARDPFLTPYSAAEWPNQEMPGVIVHAQMVSQILSAVLDGRPLLTVLPIWGEILGIWVWSVVGGVLAWRWQSILYLGLAGSAAIGVLYLICLGFLIQGIWLPLVPSALALILASGSVIAQREWRAKRQQETFFFKLSNGNVYVTDSQN
jgi:CHASE2 domain-containing sensor protein